MSRLEMPAQGSDKGGIYSDPESGNQQAGSQSAASTVDAALFNDGVLYSPVQGTTAAGAEWSSDAPASTSINANFTLDDLSAYSAVTLAGNLADNKGSIEEKSDSHRSIALYAAIKKEADGGNAEASRTVALALFLLVVKHYKKSFIVKKSRLSFSGVSGPQIKLMELIDEQTLENYGKVFSQQLDVAKSVYREDGKCVLALLKSKHGVEEASLNKDGTATQEQKLRVCLIKFMCQYMNMAEDQLENLHERMSADDRLQAVTTKTEEYRATLLSMVLRLNAIHLAAQGAGHTIKISEGETDYISEAVTQLSKDTRQDQHNKLTTFVGESGLGTVVPGKSNAAQLKKAEAVCLETLMSGHEIRHFEETMKRHASLLVKDQPAGDKKVRRTKRFAARVSNWCSKIKKSMSSVDGKRKQGDPASKSDSASSAGSFQASDASAAASPEPTTPRTEVAALAASAAGKGKALAGRTKVLRTPSSPRADSKLKRGDTTAGLDSEEETEEVAASSSVSAVKKREKGDRASTGDSASATASPQASDASAALESEMPVRKLASSVSGGDALPSAQRKRKKPQGNRTTVGAATNPATENPLYDAHQSATGAVVVIEDLLYDVNAGAPGAADTSETIEVGGMADLAAGEHQGRVDNMKNDGATVTIEFRRTSELDQDDGLYMRQADVDAGSATTTVDTTVTEAPLAPAAAQAANTEDLPPPPPEFDAEHLAPGKKAPVAPPPPKDDAGSIVGSFPRVGSDNYLLPTTAQGTQASGAKSPPPVVAPKQQATTSSDGAATSPAASSQSVQASGAKSPPPVAPKQTATTPGGGVTQSPATSPDSAGAPRRPTLSEQRVRKVPPAPRGSASKIKDGAGASAVSGRTATGRKPSAAAPRQDDTGHSANPQRLTATTTAAATATEVTDTRAPLDELAALLAMSKGSGK